LKDKFVLFQNVLLFICSKCTSFLDYLDCISFFSFPFQSQAAVGAQSDIPLKQEEFEITETTGL